MAAPDTTRRDPGPTGWAVFAAVILLLVVIIYGLTARWEDAA
jgi:hypothetical protein